MTTDWRTVRVFISSTFRDMGSERDHLVRFVFPRLRDRLLVRRIHLVDVDLRWGVTSDQDATEICREIIDECRPRFLCMLGGRYGWVPSGMSRSITADEVHYGVIDHEIINRGFCHFYFRDQSSTAAMIEASPGEFREPPQSVNELKLAHLKASIISEGLAPFTYSAQWDNESRRLINLRTFGDRVYDDLLNGIASDPELSVRFGTDDAPAPNEFDDENAAMESFVEERRERFVPGSRDGVLEELVVHAFGSGGPPAICVTGPPGSGKSALLAHLSRDPRLSDHTRIAVVRHFVGASPGSVDVRRTLRRLCHELNKACPGVIPEIPDDPDLLPVAIDDTLRRACAQKRVVILIDAINQFDSASHYSGLYWLPAELPPNARLIFSSLAGPALEDFPGAFTSSATFSPDGARIAGTSDQSLKIWDATSGALVGSYACHTLAQACAWTGDSTRIVVSHLDGTVDVRDAATGSILRTVAQVPATISACASLDEGGGILGAGGDYVIRLWTEAGGARGTVTGHSDDVRRCVEMPGGEAIPSCSDDGSVRAQSSGPPDPGNRGAIPWAAFARLGDPLFIAGADGTVRLLDTDTGMVEDVWETPAGTWGAGAISPDGGYVAIGGHGGQLVLVDRRNGVHVALSGHQHDVRCCAFSPDGSLLVAGGGNREAAELSVWDVERRACIARPEGHTRVVSQCGFSPDGRRLFSASADGTAAIWDPGTASKVCALAETHETNGNAAWSPDGRYVLVTLTDWSAALCDPGTGEAAALLAHHPEEIKGGCFSPDGALAATWCADGTVAIWQTRDLVCQCTFAAHTGAVSACAFFPDVPRLVSGGADAMLIVWDLTTGERIASFPTVARVTTVAVSADGRTIFGGDAAGEVYLLELKEAAMVPA